MEIRRAAVVEQPSSRWAFIGTFPPVVKFDCRESALDCGAQTLQNRRPWGSPLIYPACSWMTEVRPMNGEFCIRSSKKRSLGCRLWRTWKDSKKKFPRGQILRFIPIASEARNSGSGVQK